MITIFRLFIFLYMITKSVCTLGETHEILFKSTEINVVVVVVLKNVLLVNMYLLVFTITFLGFLILLFIRKWSNLYYFMYIKILEVFCAPMLTKCTLFFTLIKPQACVCVCVHAFLYFDVIITVYLSF